MVIKSLFCQIDFTKVRIISLYIIIFIKKLNKINLKTGWSDYSPNTDERQKNKKLTQQKSTSDESQLTNFSIGSDIIQ